MLSVRDPIRRRQPVERPLDIVALELLVSVSQALLAGVLLSLAAQLGGDARANGLPIPGLLAVLGIAVGVGWLRWLMGGSGALMASVCLATAILTGALWLLALQDQSLPRIDPWVGLIGAACAVYGLVAGVFLDGPHRGHWKGGVSQPRRGVPQTRATPARFSPPVQKVVDERLTDLRLPRPSLPEGRRLTMPTLRRTIGATAEPAPESATGATDEPAVEAAPDTPVEPTTSPEPVAEPLEDITATETATEATAPEPIDTDAATEATASEPADPEAATEATAPTEVTAATDATAAEPSDPDAPTQPVARPAPQWPRPIEPRGHTGGHRTDADT